ncbi:diguanylate cyclase [Marinobacter vulgaris]|uniref:diguanylate cyclase n=1 Tax=Marinobacter vulgaris TaxID=1928331 RepID=A0A2V4A2U3_9GAMM|nr:diguanylate cyclase [Marinobacter vulgaris]PXX93300.1 diguanylate cyclase [Marinobacter vulgaris]TSJ72688.1 diguanylate cyclase [Marinobacter vulgaris]
MDNNPPAGVADKLAHLRLTFRQRAAGELEQLISIAERLPHGKQRRPDTTDDIALSYGILHRLAGSAGTFGYTALGDQARRLEHRLKPLAEHGALTTDDDLCRREKNRQQLLEIIAGVEGLRSLLDETDESLGATPERRAGSGDETNKPARDIHVVLCGLSEKATDFLDHALSNYGFLISTMEIESLSLQTKPGMTTVVTSEDRLAEVSKVLGSLEHADGTPGPPLLCLGRQDDFNSRYALAEAGADAFFPEPVDAPQLAERIERLVHEQNELVSGKILILDDDEHLVAHYRTVLENAGFRVRAISKPETILSELSEFRPDIMLLDVRMGAYSGTTVAKLIRFDPEWVSLPIVYLSSEQDKHVQLEALAKGADEFMTKPVSDDYLVRTAQIRCYRARQLNELLIKDSLTGLLKHSVIKQEVENEHARCQRMSHVSSVAMVDLDHFKAVNDQHGHRTGDVVIKALANLLRNRLRSTDQIGRYGGEEFAIILPECTTDQAQEVLTQICEAFADISFATPEGDLSVTLSAGIAALDAFASGSDALDAADQALYERKAAGRNGVTVFTRFDAAL